MTPFLLDIWGSAKTLACIQVNSFGLGYMGMSRNLFTPALNVESSTCACSKFISDFSSIRKCVCETLLVK